MPRKKIKSNDEIALEKCYAASKIEKKIVQDLMTSGTTIILEGQQGSGKTFLFKVAQLKMSNNFFTERALPVYISFLDLKFVAKNNLSKWIVAKITKEILIVLQKTIAIAEDDSVLDFLKKTTNINDTLVYLEDTIHNISRGEIIPNEFSLHDLKNWIEIICRTKSISRIVLFLDDISNVFLQPQQLLFFDVLRDLRMEYITFHATTYPNSQFCGDFNLTHDAFLKSLIRLPTNRSFFNLAIKIARKWLEFHTKSNIDKKSLSNEDIETLYLASSGNIRDFLNLVKNYFEMRKTLFNLSEKERESICQDILNMSEIQDKEKLVKLAIDKTVLYFQEKDIVNRLLENYHQFQQQSFEEKFPEYSKFIQWGMKFIEQKLLLDLEKERFLKTRKKNSQQQEVKKKKYLFLIEKNCPENLSLVLRILEHFNIIQYLGPYFVSGKKIYGLRYAINLQYWMKKISKKLLIGNLGNSCLIYTKDMFQEVNSLTHKG